MLSNRRFINVIVLVVMVVYLILPEYPSTQGARILAVLPFSAKSHHKFFQSVLKSLANVGHEVVVYSPFPLDNPIANYTDVYLEDVATESEILTQAIISAIESPPWKCLDVAFKFIGHCFDEFINSDKLKKLLLSKEQFDIVFTEVLGGQEIYLLFGHVFKVPVICLQSYVTNNIVNGISGNTLSLPYIPDLCTLYSNKMSFYERVLNSVYTLRGLYYFYYQRYLNYLQNKLINHFPNAPPLLDMVNNISLIFVNDHLTADYAQPRTPNIIPVAGIHIEEEKHLPEHIKSFMDEAADGVILFSLGTFIPDERQPQEYFDMYNNVFRQLRQRVLWKTRKENIQGLADNVMTVRWAPQRDVLAHPNCVLFITHGGLLSQHEAIQFGVPVVTIPHFWDQKRNARFYEAKGVGVILNFKNLTQDNVLLSIRKVLENTEYATNMKKLSSVFQDRPMTPAETVVYWTEYVLRHGGSHLRPASTQLSWYQLALLDVLAVGVIVLFTITFIVYIVFRTLLKHVCRKYFMKINKAKCD